MVHKKKSPSPKKSHVTIKVGLGTCGIAAGAQEVYNHFHTTLQQASLPYTLSKTGCLGICFSEPNVIITLGTQTVIYEKVQSNQVDAFCHALKKNILPKEQQFSTYEKRNQHPYFKSQVKLITKNCGIIDPESLEDYRASGGFTGLKKALEQPPKNIIATVTAAKIRGHGGGGFPTGLKWSLLAQEKSKDKYVLCNFDEGDPGAFMNRTIAESDPFRLLEGIMIACYATGAHRAIIYGRAEYPLALERLQRAISTLYRHGYLGKSILNSKFALGIEISKGAGAYVCGEETALMESIEGKRGMPRPRPPYPTQKGLWQQPTVINNVGTFCHVATLFQIGNKAYTEHGTKKSPGTKTICLTGKINRPGVIEVPFGITVKTIIDDIGGGGKTPLKAIQTGGPSGGCIPVSHLSDLKLDYEEICAKGSIMGSGGMVVMDEHTCMVDVAKYFLTFTQSESCGKCTPCREGTKRMLEILEKITTGKASLEDLHNLEELCQVVADTSLCGLGQTAPNPVLTTLRYFKHEYLSHIEQKICAAGICSIAPAQKLYTIGESCVGCGQCKRNCPVNAIIGSPGKKYQIMQKNCIHCGSCYRNCKFGAITMQ